MTQLDELVDTQCGETELPQDLTKADKATETPHNGYQLTEKDIKQLAMKDDEFKLMTWEDLTAIIKHNRLEELKRVPSDLKRYIDWGNKIRGEYGSIQAFVLKERLGWANLTAENPIPFASEADTKILINDWPYGIAPEILHLVVWTKAKIPIVEDPAHPDAGDITPEARRLINDFVTKTFTDHLGAENVLWFKNWASIQSVRSVEHLHVLVRGATDDFILSVVGPEANGGLKRGIGQLEKERVERSFGSKELQMHVCMTGRIDCNGNGV
ncbi:hypothetical protein RUND412_003212 [Rhizina undulata]